MRPPNSLADKLKGWQQLRATARRLAAELPHLQPEVAAFEEELQVLLAHDREHAAVTARLRELTRLRNEAKLRVRGRRNRIVALLQGHHGPESEALIEYGVSPRRHRTRRKPEPDDASPAEAPPSPGDE